MTKDYLKRQFSNFYNEVIKGNFAKSEDVENLNTDDIGIKGQTVVFDINHLAPQKPAIQTIENGVYTFVAPPSGNTWSDYPITDNDLASTDGIAKLVVNVTDISGKWLLFRVYKKASDGKTAYEAIKTITTTGEFTIDVDLSWLSMYKSYDGSGVSYVIANADDNHDTNNSIVIDKYNIVIGDDNELGGDNLTEVLASMDDRIDSLSNNSKTNSTDLATPNGEKYILQIKQDGTLQTIPKLPSNILYIGNSLLVGFGTHGAASTTVNDDYYAKVNDYLESKGKTLTTEKVAGYTFEELLSDSALTTWLQDNLSAKMSNDRELVIVQLGDNVNTAERRAEFEKSCGVLCSYIRTNCPNARVAWVGTWYSDNKHPIIIDACNKYGVTFVDIHDLRTINGNQSHIGATYIGADGTEKTVTTDGVASHPSDQGFTAIANRIITTLFE